MRVKELLPFASLLAATFISSMVDASAQVDKNYAQRVLPGSVPPPLASPPNRSGLTPSSSRQSDENLRLAIMKDCGVAAWQVSVTTEAGGQMRVQMSPTLQPEVKKCITTEAAAGK